MRQFIHSPLGGFALGMLGLGGVSCHGGPSTPHEDPTEAIATALDTVWVAAIGENHGHEEFHTWVRSALADARWRSRVDDVAVEFGNARYQEIADRYVRGEDVPLDSVSLIWRNTVVSPNPVWDSPVYGRFVEGIRAINGTRTDGRAYRLLLLDPPVNWDAVRTRSDLSPFLDRAGHMAATLEREVLRPGRRAVVIAGAAHLTRVNMVRRNRAGVPTAELPVVSRLAERFPGSQFVVRSTARTGDLDGDWLPSVPPGRLVRTRSPPLQTISANRVATMRNADGSPFAAYGAATLTDLVDAIIYWGGEPNNTFAAPAVEPADSAYWTERNRRSMIVQGVPLDPASRPGGR